ncbi:MAG TPA: TraB/GumN family protein [Candidatus Limiplasma sp.]|nr:TraB/GumN family protein [Candidatus Limiplasma sp.]HRX09381.1 TraB/GumN family protein [Candidatus Limiplasma sp.]
MRKRIWIAAAALVVVAAIIVGVVLVTRHQEGSHGILYRVTGDQGTSYLLGSIHIGTDEMYPFGNAIAQAMDSADTFVFESDTDSTDSIIQLQARMSLPDGVTLRDILGDALVEQVIAAYKENGLNPSKIDTQQPWVIISTLAVYSTANEMGITNVSKAISLGVDSSVKDYADRHNKQFRYLETMDEFADMMESFSPELTRYLIADEVKWILHRESDAPETVLKQWPVYWRDGDAEAFWRSYQQSLADADQDLYREYEDKLVAERNVKMADRLDAMFQEGDSYFVTVGLLHLITQEGSIPELLRDMGYTVERVLN